MPYAIRPTHPIHWVGSSSIHDLTSLDIPDAVHSLVSQIWNIIHHPFHIQMTNGSFHSPQSADCFKSHSNKMNVPSTLEKCLFIAMSSLAIFPNNSKLKLSYNEYGQKWKCFWMTCPTVVLSMYYNNFCKIWQ